MAGLLYGSRGLSGDPYGVHGRWDSGDGVVEGIKMKWTSLSFSGDL